jgi:hypothetical protein
VTFHEQPLPDSCRPWVAIERPEVSLPGGGTIRYRFEVQVPKDAPMASVALASSSRVTSRLRKAARCGCRSPGASASSSTSRSATAANIQIFGPDVVTLNGRKIPALRVLNDGNVHARVSGFLTGKDASGKSMTSPLICRSCPGDARGILTPRPRKTRIRH